MQLQSQTTILFVLSALKIEKTGPETAKISPKMAKKAIFDPKMHKDDRYAITGQSGLVDAVSYTHLTLPTKA